MKGVHMKHLKAVRATGFFISALVFLFTLTTVGQASARDTAFKSLLNKNAMSIKIVKLDREDGFRYGLSLKSKNRTVLIAPGYDRMLLVQADGVEAVVQPDATGTLQVIQADDVDIRYVICIAQAVLGFFQNLTYCTQAEYACYFGAVFTIFTDLTACTPSVTP